MMVSTRLPTATSFAVPSFADLSGDIRVSFEFFPPKTESMEATMWETIKTLEPLNPRFVSVTYGAGGSTRERTHANVARILRDTSLIPAAHLTCVAASKSEVNEVAQDYWNAGVRHIVAIRGDSTAGIGEKFVPHPDGYKNGADLVAGLKKVADFEISVGAYPESHPESPSRLADVENLKRKVDAGATRGITQFFFDPDDYFRYLDLVHASGLDVEILPGILPVTNFAQLKKMAAATGASIPAWMGGLFEGLDAHPAARQLVAATVAADMCRRMYDRGVRDFHFYTLNRAELSFAICHMLGVRAPEANSVGVAA
jgi:methylenetetrahydrofolate reductase (NADPH)